MATLDEINDLVVGAPKLRQRFQASRLKAAWNILNEAANTTNHAARLTWANKIINIYESDLDKEYRRFLSNATIQTAGNSATDNDIDFVVSSFVDTFAGG